MTANKMPEMPEAESFQYRYRHELPNGGKCAWRPADKVMVEQFQSEFLSAYETRGLYTADQMRAMYLAGIADARACVPEASSIDAKGPTAWAAVDSWNHCRHETLTNLTALEQEAKK